MKPLTVPLGYWVGEEEVLLLEVADTHYSTINNVSLVVRVLVSDTLFTVVRLNLDLVHVRSYGFHVF